MILLFALSLSGCTSYLEQETFINEGGSGHTTINICITPKEFIANMLLAAVEKTGAETGLNTALPETPPKAAVKIKCDIKEDDLKSGFADGCIKNVTFKRTESDGAVYFCFNADFDDITTLYADKTRIAITEDKNGFVTYAEHLIPSDAGVSEEEGANKHAPELFESCRLRYILHMPRDIVSANTANVDKNTAVWDIPMDEAMKQKDIAVTATIAPRNKFLKWRDGIFKKRPIL